MTDFTSYLRIQGLPIVPCFPTLCFWDRNGLSSKFPYLPRARIHQERKQYPKASY